MSEAFWAVLTSDRPLTEPEVGGVAEAIGAQPRWISPKATEFASDGSPLPAPPPGTDLNLVPAAGRVKSVLIADMDSTIITVECIDELADFAGVKAEVAAITERAMRGELDFEEALEARVARLAGIPVSALETCYAERVRLSPGAETAVRACAARGARTALVSGGFTFFAERVGAAAGFESTQANELECVDGRLTGRVVPPILGRDAKADALERLARDAGVGPEAVLAVGDGANDLAMIRAAGLGVAYRAKPQVAEAADCRLDHSDLEALLALQGLSA
ncbi:MAG: phosphoserine phosphatase SerB [Pseudomonadota bacterium]